MLNKLMGQCFGSKRPNKNTSKKRVSLSSLPGPLPKTLTLVEHSYIYITTLNFPHHFHLSIALNRESRRCPAPPPLSLSLRSLSSPL